MANVSLKLDRFAKENSLNSKKREAKKSKKEGQRKSFKRVWAAWAWWLVRALDVCETCGMYLNKERIRPRVAQRRMILSFPKQVRHCKVSSTLLTNRSTEFESNTLLVNSRDTHTFSGRFSPQRSRHMLLILWCLTISAEATWSGKSCQVCESGFRSASLWLQKRFGFFRFGFFRFVASVSWESEDYWDWLAVAFSSLRFSCHGGMLDPQRHMGRRLPMGRSFRARFFRFRFPVENGMVLASFKKVPGKNRESQPEDFWICLIVFGCDAVRFPKRPACFWFGSQMSRRSFSICEMLHQPLDRHLIHGSMIKHFSKQS